MIIKEFLSDGGYRYEKLVESEEKSYQEQRRRLQVDHANRIKECEEKEAQVQLEKEKAIKQAQEEFEDRIQVIDNKINKQNFHLKKKIGFSKKTLQRNKTSERGFANGV